MAEGWETAVRYGLWVVGVALVLRWLERMRSVARAPSEKRCLSHPVSTLVVGLVGFAFFAAIGVLSNLFPNRTTTWWSTAVFALFALLNAGLIGEYIRSRHEVNASGLCYGRLLGRRGRIEWTDVRSVRYEPEMRWFRLEGSAGRVARVSVLLRGLPEFARLLLEHAPPAALEPGTRSVLVATAAGRPPSLW